MLWRLMTYDLLWFPRVGYREWTASAAFFESRLVKINSSISFPTTITSSTPPTTITSTDITDTSADITDEQLNIKNWKHPTFFDPKQIALWIKNVSKRFSSLHNSRARVPTCPSPKYLQVNGTAIDLDMWIRSG